MNKRKSFYPVALLIMVISFASPSLPHLPSSPLADDPSPPAEPVKLIFIHHSTGGNWLADPNSDQPSGGLGSALMENNYFVSATNYGWGPEGIGDRTDIINWPEWFTGPNRDTYLEALYNESGQNVGGFGSWSRLPGDPGGENTVVMFKSCFPNSDLYGSPDDPPYAEANDWEYSVSNAKAVYNDLLTYFETRQDKLFVVITAPPLMSSETAPERAVNARAFNNWLVNDWLTDYPYTNVAVFDYYNVLTSNGGDANVNDRDAETGNHHRWWDGAVQHLQTVDNDFSAYPSGDSHPSSAGHQKASAEFVPLLNVFYNRWQTGAPPPPPAEEPTAPPPAEEPTAPPPTEEPTAPPPAEEPTAPPPPVAPPPLPGVIDDFESAADQWMPDIGGDDSDAECGPDEAAHSGAGSLHLYYDVAPQEWVGCGRYFETPQDWSSGNGFSLWLRSDEAGQWITLALFSGDPNSPTPFEVHFETPEDWTQLVFAWADFERAEWADAEGPSELDPARITGLGFSLGADEERVEGTLWLDDLGLVSEEIQPPPTAAPPTATAEPIADVEPTTPVEPTTADVEPTAAVEPTTPVEEEPSDEGGLSTGVLLAGAVVVLLLVGGIALWVTRRR